jgi:hypothetical protein
MTLAAVGKPSQHAEICGVKGLIAGGEVLTKLLDQWK